MLTDDFYYDLPQDLIAQHPVYPRDSSRLLVYDREKNAVNHDNFFNLDNYLNKGDLLILNDTRVIPARLFCKSYLNNSPLEILLLKEVEKDIWEIICKPGKKAKVGKKFYFDDNLSGEIVDVLKNGNRHIKFFYKGDFFDILDKIGKMPLPPYIKEELKDKENYQTVYSEKLGSAAAPTAGLHFTENLLNKLTERGIIIAKVTLHVGLGTFRPVKSEKVEDHIMHSEYFEIPNETIAQINKAKQTGNKVIAVGTTSCRTLEGGYQKWGGLKPDKSQTDIFIYPGFEFKVIDGLITNFHLPKSSLIMLVSAFCGYKNTMKLYKDAIDLKYRFFSFGDAMFIK